MLDRRSFLTAAVGAATFPMPALARAQLEIAEIGTRQLLAKSRRDGSYLGVNSVYPTVSALPKGGASVAWTHYDGSDDGTATMVQSFGADLSPHTDPAMAGSGGYPTAIALSETSGLVLTASLDRPGARPMAADGELRGTWHALQQNNSRAQTFGPRLAPLADGSFLAAYSVVLDRRRQCAMTVVVGLDGRRRSAFVPLFASVPKETQVLVHGAFPVTGGAVVIAQLWDGTKRQFVFRRRALDGTLGPLARFGAAKVSDLESYHADFALVGPDRIAGVWAEGDQIVGGLFKPDGRRILAFEPRPIDSGCQFSVQIGANAILRVSSKRLLSLAGPTLYDLATGKIVGRPTCPLLPAVYGCTRLSGDRFALVATAEHGDGPQSWLTSYALA